MLTELQHQPLQAEQIHGPLWVKLRRMEWVVEREGVPLAVEVSAPAGQARGDVLLIHGLAQNRFTWRVSQRSMVGELVRQGFRVFNLELRGHGRSRALGAPNARSFREYVEDTAFVLEQMPRPAVVVGHSLGAAVAVGASTSVEVQGLVHLAGVYVFATRNRSLRGLARLTLGLEPVLTAAPVRVSTGWAGHLLGRLYGATELAGYGFPIRGWATDSMERDLLAERLELGFDWTSTEVWLEMARWAQGAPFPYAVPFRGVDVPLLVVAGDDDALVTPADARACFDASMCEDKTFVVFGQERHGVPFGHVDLILGRRAPEVVWPELLRWIHARSPG